MIGNVIRLCVIVVLSGCAASSDDYSPLTLTREGDHFVARGEIDDTTPDVLYDAFEDSPGIKRIVFQFVPGSLDDEANLEASRMIRARGMTTVLPAGGLVASGGTDMFLAGSTREIMTGACVGVHSWATTSGTEGKDVPRHDPQHQLYLSYYEAMGIDRDFYWFTLNAADAENMHYLSKSEIERYGLATRSIKGNAEVNVKRCEEIASFNGGM